MSYTIAEKILLDHSPEIKEISTGQFIECEIDLVMVHEQLGGRIHREYEKLGNGRRVDKGDLITTLRKAANATFQNRHYGNHTFTESITDTNIKNDIIEIRDALDLKFKDLVKKQSKGLDILMMALWL